LGGALGEDHIEDHNETHDATVDKNEEEENKAQVLGKPNLYIGN